MTAVLNLNLFFLYYLFVSEIVSYVYSIVDFRSLTLPSPLKMFFLENTKVVKALNCKKKLNRYNLMEPMGTKIYMYITIAAAEQSDYLALPYCARNLHVTSGFKV